MKPIIGRASGAAIAALAVFAAPQAHAEQRWFDLPAGVANRTLPEFARRAGLQIIAPSGELDGIRTPRLNGRMDTRQALRTLLAGSGLVIAQDRDNVIILKSARPAPGGASGLRGTPTGYAPAADAAAPGERADSAEIVVTGTRIRRADLESNSPITAVGASEIQYQGAISVENTLNRMPQFTADANETISNGSDGRSNINLRHLGSNRLLVLVNGQRLHPQQQVDLTFVPTSLVERVDVVTGGASAVYGSDALSGVVNFILRDHLDGLHFDAQHSVYQHENDSAYLRSVVAASGYTPPPRTVIDGGKSDANIAFGKNFADGRGNITVYAGYRTTSPILQDQRDVSACSYSATGATGNAYSCYGSSTSSYGLFIPQTGPNAGRRLVNARDGSGTLVPYDQSYQFNLSPTNYLQRQDRRYTGGGFAHFKVSDAAEVYGSFMYGDDVNKGAAAPLAYNNGTLYTINCNNPLLSASQATALCGTEAGNAGASVETFVGYRPSSATPRIFEFRRKNSRYTAGVRGSIAEGLSYDVNYLRSLIRYNYTVFNGVIDTRKAQDALLVDLVNGVPTCRAVIDGTDPNCRPVDVFRPGGIDTASNAYLFAPSYQKGRYGLTVYSATLNGDLGAYGLSSPWAEHGLALALGAEHRRETLNFEADELSQQDGFSPADGVIEASEGYAELEIPILSNLPFAQALTLNGGARYSHYRNRQNSTGFSSSYNVWTYKGELSYAPIRDLRFRASYNRAIRAPNVGELFGSVTYDNLGASDPCSGDTPTASLAQCLNTGITAEQYGRIAACSSEICVTQAGGNRALKPETADTYTVGFILTPRRLRTFSLSVDFYRIKVKDYIGTIPSNVISTQCLTTGSPYYCSLIHRDPRTGVLFGTGGSGGYYITTTQNTGYLLTSGIDVNSSYRLGVGRFGSVSFDLTGSYLRKFANEPLVGLGAYECQGLYGYGCGAPLPRWRHLLRTTWALPGEPKATLSLAWRYVGPTTIASTSSNPALSQPVLEIARRIKPYNYFDLATSVRFRDGLTLRAGVNNLADRAPPVIQASGGLGSFANGNTFGGLYDAFGRTLYLGLSVDL